MEDIRRQREGFHLSGEEVRRMVCHHTVPSATSPELAGAEVLAAGAAGVGRATGGGAREGAVGGPGHGVVATGAGGFV